MLNSAKQIDMKITCTADHIRPLILWEYLVRMFYCYPEENLQQVSTAGKVFILFYLFLKKEVNILVSMKRKRKRIHMRVNDVIRIRKESNDASKQANDRQDSTSGATVTFAQLHPLPECDG